MGIDDIQGLLEELSASGAERAVQVAVYRDGEEVLSAAAGGATPETVFYTYSSMKAGMSALVHVCVREGMFGYDTALAKLWPEFAEHGKGDVTVRHVLTHSAGLPAVPPDTTPEDLCDWDGMCARLAAAEPWWPAGAKMAYHAITYGYLAGEVVRRATGLAPGAALRELVAAPIGFPDELYFGMPPVEQPRLAPLVDAADITGMPDDSPMLRTVPRALLPTAEYGNRPDILAADIPAGGKNTARALAALYSALIDGTLLPPAQLAEVTAVALSAKDEVMGNDARWCLGFAVGRPGSDSADAFCLAGAGGTFAWADRATGTTVAVAKNLLTPGFDTAQRVCDLVYA
ncbi:serine hydrolase domain-containing protein [Dactylosporangium darangshiense]|uniref:Serine hydrolase domain-containing protein n=1 Tax=Dactylosporangium darangshiense TaxID=579108 RepID=A0ABP8DDL5_9ACTN